MFGGHGFYVDGIFIALIISERLYLKADALTVPLFEGVGCEQFVYIGSGRTLKLGYFSAPEDVMDSPAAMQPWARLALEAALSAKAEKPVKKATKPRIVGEKPKSLKPLRPVAKTVAKKSA